MSRNNSDQRKLSLRNLFNTKAIATMLVAVAALIGFRHQISGGVSYLVNGNSEISISQEIDQISEMIDGLVPDIRTQMTCVAKATSQLKQSERTVKGRQHELNSCQSKMKRIHSAIKDANERVELNSEVTSEKEAKAELHRLLMVAQLLEDTLNVERATVSSNRMALAREKNTLKELIDKRKEMEVQVANFRARMASVNSRQSGQANRDHDDLLKQCRDKVDEVSARLEIAEQLLEIQSEQFVDHGSERDSIEQSNDDVLDQVSRYLDSQKQLSFGGSGSAF